MSDAVDEELARIARAYVHRDDDRAIKRGYLRWLSGCERVLDVGCGEGTLLDELAAHGITAIGIDRSSAAAAACRARGHDVREGDALPTVRQLADAGETYGAAVLAHLIEHLEPGATLELLRAVAAILRPGSRLLVVTPNVRNLIVLSEVFWLDPTHVRPYPRPLVERLGHTAGFTTVASYDDPASVPRRGVVGRWLAALRSRLSGADRSAPMDAVVVLEDVRRKT